MSREITESSREKEVTISCGCRRNRIGSFGCCGGLLGFNNNRRHRNCFCNRRRNENRRHRRINSCC